MTNIHPNSYVHSTALLGDNVTVEENAYIGPLCIIGFQPEWKGHEHEDAGVIICKGARLTGMITVDTGVHSPTSIGANSYIMKHAHIGHDALIGEGVIIACGAKIGGHAWIGFNTNIGLNAVIHQHKSVPENCMIGMGSVITKGLEMLANQKYVGNPAKWLSVNEKK